MNPEFNWKNKISSNITAVYFQENPVLLLVGNSDRTNMKSKHITANEKKEIEKKEIP